MGILSACYDKLTCEQASDLLDSLEYLATDTVPGVRYAVAAALQHLKRHAVALFHGQLQKHQHHATGVALLDVERQQQKQQSRESYTAHDAANEQQQPAGAAAVDSYAAYVQQLASRSGSVSCRRGHVGQASAGQASPPADATPEGQGSLCSPACAVCGVLPWDAGDEGGLEWLRKLCCCQQLERLMGVVALTTGPL
jgi:hypothetical protein